MFRQAAATIREVLYGIIARSNLGASTNHNMGSGVMVAQGLIVTNAHILHLNGDVANCLHREFEVIRSPDIGKNPVKATLVGEDTFRDIALLRIDDTSNRYASLEPALVASGTSCGSLGFPLSVLQSNNGQTCYCFIERFQGAYVSAYIQEYLNDKLLCWYEVDRVMYGGSSGCPFFTPDGKVIGLQTRVRDADGDPHNQNFLAISLLIPSTEVLKFLKNCQIQLP